MTKSILVLIPLSLALCSCATLESSKNKSPKNSSAKKEDPKTPSLTSPEVRRVWVPEKIDGDKFIDGHYMYLIERNSVWSK